MNRLSKAPSYAWLRKQGLFFLLASMLIAAFLSRTALSITMIAFVIVAFLHRDIRSSIRHFLHAPLLWGMSLLFFLPFVSGLWSENIPGWFSIMVIKAPLLFMPLAFANPFYFTIKDWKRLAILLITLTTSASAWSFYQYCADPAFFDQGYLSARSIPTLLDNDRVRFSWLIAIAILITGILYFQQGTSRKVKWIYACIAVWLIIFLHVLAVRTGLISFYIIVVVFFTWMAAKKKLIISISILSLLIILPLAAYFLLPSFKNRIHFFLYEQPFFKNLSYIPGGNDATRMISLKAGWEIMNDQPLSGPGLGDIDSATATWYHVNYPQMMEADRIAPSSEWLIYGLSNGWPGLLLFTFIMLIPFMLADRKRISWIMLNLVTAFSFLFDIGLEVQFGVFIYSFILLCWWKYLQEKPAPPLQSAS